MTTDWDGEASTPPAERPGDHLVRELLWVHGLIRRDLQTLRDLAERVVAGASPEEVRAEIGSLQTNSPLWKLRVNCLYYCRFVHTHHTLEDWALFPALRRSSPALGPVVDKLEADHRQVSGHLDDVEAAADDLVQEDTPTGRRRMVEALNAVALYLLAHLDYEEQAITPTLREMAGWPAR
jgi:hypothetical protein